MVTLDLLDQRVKERTQELMSNRDALHRALKESELQIATTAAKINTSLATLKGLCLLGSDDREDARAYLTKVLETLNDVRHIVARSTRKEVSEFH